MLPMPNSSPVCALLFCTACGAMGRRKGAQDLQRRSITSEATAAANAPSDSGNVSDNNGKRTMMLRR
eukprot:1176463-Prorocentrum_minimum.AAC.1